MTKFAMNTNHEIRLIALDIDGTIAGESNEVNPAVIEALQAVQAKGIQVTLATGRMYCAAQYYAQAIGTQVPIICYNGAWIQAPQNQQRLWHVPVPIELAWQLLDYCEQPERQALLEVHFYLNDQLYVREVTEQTQFYMERSRIQAHPVGDLRKMLDQPPTKVLAMSSQPELIKTVFRSLQQQYCRDELYLTQSNPYFLEVCHPNASKGQALRYLTEQILNIKPENAIAIGDNFNDLEMLQYAGIGIAMGDAPPEVKAQADGIAPKVEADGVITALEKWI